LSHDRDLIVLGLPRGGVPVAFEIAEALGAPLDVMVVRKLGAPGRPEFALGAVASGGVRVMNPAVEGRVSDQEIDQVEQEARRALEARERALRGTSGGPDVRGKRVVLVDDGIATGSTMKAAVEAVRKLGAKEVVVAAPVASPSAAAELRELADRTVVPSTPAAFLAIGQFYEDFSQVSTEAARACLERARSR
jgi:predicted phosphoribosyltransferase